MGRVILSGASKGMTKPTVGAPISELAVGSPVRLSVNGTVTDFLIVNQGIPSNSILYDSSCNGTWLLMKNIYENRVWQSGNINKYESSDIHTYLNNTYLNGSAAAWWLRSPRASNAASVWGVYTNGDSFSSSAVNSRGIRPALILPSTLSVNKNGMVIA